MIGRKEQILTLHHLLQSNKSEFVAITGRRRVGKTYLIDTVYQKNICLRISGIQDGNLAKQLFNFMDKLSEASGLVYKAVSSWQQAFYYLKQYCNSLKKKSKCVIFLDELPWMNTPKSGFLQLLAHFWNDYLSKDTKYILVICGSASSWITKKIINDKGGLHNRLTEIIRLTPFTLQETKQFLESKNISYSQQNIALVYMIMGGVPYYLNLLRRGESVNAAIERICFAPNGTLHNEYNNLFKALFYNASNHEAIITALSTSKSGLTREQIITKSKISSGGPYNRIMEDLILSGFITEDNLFGRKKRGSIYKLVDEYAMFYHRFIKPVNKYTKGIWHNIANSQSFKIFCGHAFEAVCIKHINAIKNDLGISNVYTEIYAYSYIGTKTKKGFQIDLIIDRKDDTINICEMKFYAGNFTISKAYADELRHKKQAFIEQSNTKKMVHITFVTNQPITQNQYSLELVEQNILLENLFM